jgi:hypothetical protein
MTRPCLSKWTITWRKWTFIIYGIKSIGGKISGRKDYYRFIVKQYLNRVEAAGLTVGDALQLTPLQLSQIIYSVQKSLSATQTAAGF